MAANTEQESSQIARLVPLFGAGLGALVFVIGCTAFFGFTADDAFIVVRYAQNLVEHGELAFNLGERTSALTSPLHALITAGILAVVGVQAIEVTNKLLGAILVLISVGSAALVMLPRRTSQGVLVATTLASPFVWLWTVGGLETPYLLAAVTAIAMTYARIKREVVVRGSLFWTLGILTAAALLLRADACLFLAPLWLSLSRKHWRAMVMPTVLTGALVLAWYGFSAYYFRDLLPTSFYVKLLHKPKPLADNVVYSLQFLVLSGAVLLAIAAIAGRRSFGSWRQRVQGIDGQAALWTGLAMIFVYSLSHSAQHMFFAFRLFVPYLPVAFLLLAAMPGIEGWRAGACVMVVVVGQLVVARQMFSRGINVTLSMLVADRHSEEYDDVSLIEYMGFIAALERSAEPVYGHWLKHASELPQPRLAVYTGGVPPLRLPEFLVFEELVSYRKQCDPNFFLEAHYAQILRIAEKDDSLRKEFAKLTLRRTGLLPEVVSREVFSFNGHPFAVEVLFNPKPLPVTIPPYVGDVCSSSTGP